TLRAERRKIATSFAEVEGGAKRVVHENAVGIAFAQGEVKRNGLVEGVGRFLPAEGVGVPVGEGGAASIEGACLVAEAVVVLVVGNLLVDVEAAGRVDRHRVARVVFGNHLSGRVDEGEAERVFLDANPKVRRGDDESALRVLHLEVDVRSAGSRYDGPGEIRA